jgi:hypothetical protein
MTENDRFDELWEANHGLLAAINGLIAAVDAMATRVIALERRLDARDENEREAREELQ